MNKSETFRVAVLLALQWIFWVGTASVLVGHLGERFARTERQRRIAVALAAALVLATIYTGVVGAAYYDTRYYCDSWIGFFDFITC